MLFPGILLAGFSTFAQTTLTEDNSGNLNVSTVVAATTTSQSVFVGHQSGASFTSTLPIFSAVSDNPSGAANYFYNGTANGTTTFSIRADGLGYFGGKVGIGAVAPNAMLQVMGTSLLSGTNGNIAPAQVPNLNFLASSAQMLIGWNRSASFGETDLISNPGTGSTGGFAFYNHDNSNNETQLMWVRGDGSVCIGATDPKGYKLAVNGTAVATSVTVKLNTNWPDYVLNNKYSLPALPDVEKYIFRYHRLPDLPGADQLEKDGIDLGEMNTLLTKKVEELTLYMIDKDKQVNALLEANKLQLQENKKLQQEIDGLKQQWAIRKVKPKSIEKQKR